MRKLKNKNLILELASENYDEKILSLLFRDEKIKEKFFIKTGNSWIFKCNHFQFFLEEHHDKPL